MRKRKSWLLLAVVVLIIFTISFRHFKLAGERVVAAVVYGSFFYPNLNHEQEVWLHALEWCESRGIKTAVNPKDVDGTPSYYSFQFKPSTFKFYGVKYGLFSRKISDAEIAVKLKDYKLQKKMVSLMILDDQVNWRQEFPACVRRLGFPPEDK